MIGYSRQNVKKIAVHLEDAGLVQLQKDINDGRVLRIALTRRCNLYLETRKEKENEFIENLYAGITDDEIEMMFLTMKKLENNILKLS